MTNATTLRTSAGVSKAPPPSRWWYLLAAGCVVAGFAGLAAFMLPRLQALNDNLVQVVVPGEARLHLDEPGTYTIFHEERSVVDGRVYVSDTISGLKITVSSEATGAPVPAEPTAMTETYDFAGRSGVSVLAFQVDAPGDFSLAAAYGDGRTEPKAVLAVGHNFLGGLMITILGGLGIVLSGIAAAVAVVFVVWRRRAAAAA